MGGEEWCHYTCWRVLGDVLGHYTFSQAANTAVFITISGLPAEGLTFEAFFLRAKTDKAYPTIIIPPNRPPVNAIGTTMEEAEEARPGTLPL